MSDIHSRIKKLREDKEISLEALAVVVGVSWQAVQQWEKPGGTAPKRTRLEKVAKALGTTAMYLLTGRQESEPVLASGNLHVFQPAAPAYVHGNKTIAEIVGILEATDEKGRIMALGAIRAALRDYVPAKANPAS